MSWCDDGFCLNYFSLLQSQNYANFPKAGVVIEVKFKIRVRNNLKLGE